MDRSPLFLWWTILFSQTILQNLSSPVSPILNLSASMLLISFSSQKYLSIAVLMPIFVFLLFSSFLSDILHIQLIWRVWCFQGKLQNQVTQNKFFISPKALKAFPKYSLNWMKNEEIDFFSQFIQPSSLYFLCYE